VDVKSAKGERGDGIDDRCSDLFVGRVEWPPEMQHLEPARYILATVWPTP
jgi:hypothetical protein